MKILELKDLHLDEFRLHIYLKEIFKEYEIIYNKTVPDSGLKIDQILE